MTDTHTSYSQNILIEEDIFFLLFEDSVATKIDESFVAMGMS